MKTLILHHDDCLKHDTGMHHPERPERVRSVLEGLAGLDGTEWLPAPKATLEQVNNAHDGEFWQALLETQPEDGRVPLDPDTWLSEGSLDATLRGSGAACFAVDQVFAKKAANAFCATRPPGHHAEGDRAMGFCLLNHVAVAAQHARSAHGIERVAILDFDVHHGNGTQEIFQDDPNTLFVSSHQVPHYPGTGMPDETGCGNILNLPLAPGTGSVEFQAAWSRAGIPRLREFDPDLVIISAGFDAHEDDPLGAIRLQDSDFAWITRFIADESQSLCDGRLVSLLEGGYNLDALSSASRAHVSELLT